MSIWLHSGEKQSMTGNQGCQIDAIFIPEAGEKVVDCKASKLNLLKEKTI